MPTVAAQSSAGGAAASVRRVVCRGWVSRGWLRIGHDPVRPCALLDDLTHRQRPFDAPGNPTDRAIIAIVA